MGKRGICLSLGLMLIVTSWFSLSCIYGLTEKKTPAVEDGWIDAKVVRGMFDFSSADGWISLMSLSGFAIGVLAFIVGVKTDIGDFVAWIRDDQGDFRGSL